MRRMNYGPSTSNGLELYVRALFQDKITLHLCLKTVTKEAHDALFGSSRLFSAVWKVCTDSQLSLLSQNAVQGLSIPSRIAWQGRGFLAFGCSGSRAVRQGHSSSGICFTVSGCLSDWSLLQEVHQWMCLWQQQAESTKSRHELTENIALKNTGIFRKNCCICDFPD